MRKRRISRWDQAYQKRKVRFWNEGAEKTTGHLRQAVLGRDADELVQSGTGRGEENSPDTKDFVTEVLRDCKPDGFD